MITTWIYSKLPNFRTTICRSRLQSTLATQATTTTTPSTVAAISLRPYQEHCLETCLDALNQGSTRIGVSLPTGSGKTTVFISLLSRIPEPTQNPAATRSLVIVHSIELARQTASQVARLFPHWTVEIEQGTKHKASGLADVTVATYQTLNNEERLQKFDPRTLKAIVVDEAHHSAAPSYRRILSRFDSDIRFPGCPTPEVPHKIPIIGFSATFSRHDGLSLGSIFQRIVYHKDFLDMIKDQWLCDVRFTSVRAHINLSEVSTSQAGDFNPTSLAKVVNTDSINDLVVRAWIDRASERKSTLVFCVNIAHVHSLTQKFRSYGIDARYIFSETPAEERKALVNAFKAGAYPVLVNCAILTEGADIPNIDCVVVARPTRSRNVFAQMIGRGMRLSPATGKSDCRIIDFVDSEARVDGVVCTPTLFGLNPLEVAIDDETPASLEEKAERMEGRSFSAQDQADPVVSSLTYEDQDDPFDFLARPTKPPQIHSLSDLSWVSVGGSVYVLELFGDGYVKIFPSEDEEGCFEAQYVAPVKKKIKGHSPYMKPRPLGTGPDLATIVRACDNFVKEKSSFWRQLLRTASWRNIDCTESQKKILAKRWLKEKSSEMSPEEKLEKLNHLRKGEAANIITRLQHGSLGRWREKEKRVAKATATALKETDRRNRERVQVGIIA